MDGPTRRAVLATGAVLALSGCLPGGDDAAPAPPDPDLVLRRRAAREVGTLVAAYAAVGAAFPGPATADLGALAAEHQAHVAALRGPTSPSPRPTTAPSASPTPAVPATLPAARRWLADLERAAARRRTTEALRAGPDLARLLAAVGASESAHAALLEQADR